MVNKKKTTNRQILSEMVEDNSLQSQVISHVTVFGFRDVIPNAIMAYRKQAERFNKEADKLEQRYVKDGK